MTALEAIQTVQFVTVKEKRFAVIEADEWDALIEWLETLEDLQIFKESYDTLAQADGNRQQAGWLRWEDVRDEVVYYRNEDSSLEKALAQNDKTQCRVIYMD